MKKIGVLLIALCMSLQAYDFSVQTITTGTQDAFLVSIPWPQKISSVHDWRCFEFCTLELEQAVLKPALLENKKVFFAIPDCYQQAKTTSADAPLIEGARVAIAWASSYFRFFNLDVEILLVPHNATQEDINRTCKHYPSHSKNNAELSPEQNMRTRIQHMNTIKPIRTNYPVHAQKADLWKVAPDMHTFYPQLPEKKELQKRVVITGGAGFIGSFLTERFLADGHQVIVFDNFACCSQENIQAINNPNFLWYEYDVTNPFTIDGPVDTMIHLASYPSPVDYYKKPIATMKTGLHGTKNALELAREKNARFVMGSTSEVYGDPHVHPQPEQYPGHVDPIGKRSQYDQSKRGAETWCAYYFDTYNVDIRIMRIFNTYGPRMRLGDGRVVTNFIKASLENSAITVYGEGNQTRSFGYVSDTVDGIYRVAQSDVISELKTIDERIFNVGNPGEFSVNQVATAVNNLSKKILQRPTQITHIPQFDMSDPKVRCPDLAHIQKITDYNPAISFTQGLEKTFLYFQSQKNNYSE